jgi:formiminoglutamase
MPGVSAPSVIGGITSEEAVEIIRRTGISKKVKLVDFSEFNPAVESMISSHMLV